HYLEALYGATLDLDTHVLHEVWVFTIADVLPRVRVFHCTKQILPNGDLDTNRLDRIVLELHLTGSGSPVLVRLYSTLTRPSLRVRCYINPDARLPVRSFWSQKEDVEIHKLRCRQRSTWGVEEIRVEDTTCSH